MAIVNLNRLIDLKGVFCLMMIMLSHTISMIDIELSNPCLSS